MVIPRSRLSMTEHFLTFGPSELVTEVVLNLTLHDLLRIATASRGIWSAVRSVSAAAPITPVGT